MADRKSGPVKPPVIDLKAREASGPAEPETAAPPETETPEQRPAQSRRAARARPAAPATEATETAAPEAVATEDATPDVEVAAAGPTDAPTEASPSERIADEVSPDEAEPPPLELDRTTDDDEPVGGASPIPPPPPRPPARLAMPWSAISVAAIAGALLGAGLTYLLANWIALPQQDPPFADPAPALAEIATNIEALAGRLAAVETTARMTRVSLDATLAQIDSMAADLREEIAAVEAAIPEPQAVDLSAIETELQTLDSRVAAIAAGASSDDAAALAENLAGIEATLTELTERLNGIESRIAAGDARVAGLADEVEEARAAIAAQTRTLGGADIGPAVKLPLIVSGLESAFANGRPYVTELEGLTTLLPDLAVPPVVAAKAEQGLARPDALAARFEAALPDIIAGRTRESTGDLAQDAIEWAKALLALRPAEEIEGDTPEAIVSRLEAAVDRRDFTAAATELAKLPAPMREAAGDVGADITAHAAASAFIARLRVQALAPATEPAS